LLWDGWRGSAGWSAVGDMARRGQREKGAEVLLTAGLRKEAGELCDCCKPQSQTRAPQQGHQDQRQ